MQAHWNHGISAALLGVLILLPAPPASAQSHDDFAYWDANGNGDLTCTEAGPASPAGGRDDGLRLPAYKDNRDGTGIIYEWLERSRSSDTDDDGIGCDSGQVRQPSERHRPSTLCHPEAEGLRCVMSPAGRKPSVLDHWTGRHDSTQVLKRFSVDRHDRFRRPRGEDFGPELARVRNGFPAPMQRGEIGRPEGHKIRRQYARLDEVACGFGHTNDARYSVEDL